MIEWTTATIMDACGELVEMRVPVAESETSERMATMSERDDLDPIDAERLELLDRLTERMPDLDLDQHEVDWIAMPDDGSQALLVEGGGLDGGDGFTIATHGEDLHVVGPTSPLIPGAIGCVVIGPDGTRRLARVVPDPAAQQPDA